MSNFYLWIKVLHILAVISWMAGMLYLPRLFVYHAEAPRGSPQAKTFAVMEAQADAGYYAARLARDLGKRNYPCDSGGLFARGMVSRKIGSGDWP